MSEREEFVYNGLQGTWIVSVLMKEKENTETWSYKGCNVSLSHVLKEPLEIVNVINLNYKVLGLQSAE